MYVKMWMLLIVSLGLGTVGVRAGELTNDGWECGGDLWDDRFICDGFVQCDDDSDEGAAPGEGCNLFPESGCPSPGARRRFRCARTGECFDQRGQAEECETSTGPPARDCEVQTISGETVAGWKCKLGRCIEPGHVCDGASHCGDHDDSDESREPYSGCNRFPGNVSDTKDAESRDTCTSWGGLKHVLCPANEVTCIPETMVAGVNVSDPATCHTTCPDTSMWRCDDGRCINETLHRNGVPDCRDGSDELPFHIYWYSILISTVLIVLTGLSLSLLCRLFYKHNAQSWFHCSLCSSSRRNEVARYNSVVTRGDEVDCGGDSLDDDTLYPAGDIPSEMIALLDDKHANWERKERDPMKQKIYGSKYSPTSLKTSVILEAKKEYLRIHMDPIRYHHLYMYLANRSATVKELAKVTKHLLDWEKELHGESKLEVVKCWRLHLGSSELTHEIINSVADEKTLASRFEGRLYPLRTLFRNCRRRLLQLKPLQDSLLYRLGTLSYYAFVPFIEGCFFYAERIKNLIYIHIFYAALSDLSKEKSILTFEFEFSLILAMSLTVAATQLFSIFYSVYYAEDIFEFGHEKKCPKSLLKRISLKLMAALLSPFIPILVLANHIYYDSKLSRHRRHLQTFKDSDDEDSEGNPEDTTDAAKADTQEKRITLYKLICKLETKSLLYRKFYSYFRVTSAVLESCTVLVCLVLLMFVTGRGNRDINLIVGVEHRLYSFFNIQHLYHEGLFSQLNLMRDIVMLGSILYSLAFILTALVKYWYQAKNLAISFSGQFILGLYLFFMTFNRLTTAVSLFATTQPLGREKFDNNASDPVAKLTVATVIFSIIFLVRLSLVYVYKKWFAAGENGWEKCQKNQNPDGPKKKVPRGWKTGDMVDKWINVLVNTVVVMPFMVQTQSLKVLKMIEKEFNFSPEKNQAKRNSLKRRTSLVKMNAEVEIKGNHIETLENVGGVMMPNMNFFIAPLLYDDFRAEIRRMWWEDPTSKLDVATIRRKMMEKRDMRLILSKMQQEDVDKNIRITLDHLENIGMVNTPLLNPVQTKREYFWLFMIVLLENVVALCIELLNGGVWTSQGHYYSWDVRLVSLVLGLVFLVAYYKKYHMTRDITSQHPACGGWLSYLPVCCCCLPDTALSAPPNEVK